MYEDIGRQASPEQLAQAIALVKDYVDTALLPGPGGNRITALGSVQGQMFLALAAVFPAGVWHRPAVVALYPSQQIVGHRDEPIEGVRFHMPLRVNDGCWVFHDGTWRQLVAGRVYRMDPTEWHGAVNWGDAVRWHLMVDVVEG